MGEILREVLYCYYLCTIIRTKKVRLPLGPGEGGSFSGSLRHMEEKMQTAKVSDYRTHLSEYHQRIMDDRDPIRIASRSGDIVILPADDYENLVETIYILKDKVTMDSLLKTRTEMANKSFQGIEVKSAFKDIMGT